MQCDKCRDVAMCNYPHCLTGYRPAGHVDEPIDPPPTQAPISPDDQDA